MCKRAHPSTLYPSIIVPQKSLNPLIIFSYKSIQQVLTLYPGTNTPTFQTTKCHVFLLHKCATEIGTSSWYKPTSIQSTKGHLFLLHKCATENSPLSWCKFTTYKIGRGRRSLTWYKLTRINDKSHRAVNHSYLSINLFFSTDFSLYFRSLNVVLRRLTTFYDV